MGAKRGGPMGKSGVWAPGVGGARGWVAGTGGGCVCVRGGGYACANAGDDLARGRSMSQVFVGF